MDQANNAAEMPKYRCHKKVWALKIKEINQSPASTVADGGSYDLVVEERFAPIQVSAELVAKHTPVPGGYYVVYEDGYKSFSPADAFEGGYTLIGMDVAVEGKDKTVEQEIQAKGLTAPRITPADIEAAIASEHYFVGGDGVYGAARKAGDYGVQQFPQALDLLTFCVLVMRNGFTVTGDSACASPENFDAELGRRIARQNAVQKVWPLMGYQLRTMLKRQEEASAIRSTEPEETHS